MSKKIFIGIDPGRKGAVALILNDLSIIRIEDCPIKDQAIPAVMNRILRGIDPAEKQIYFIVERVTPRRLERGSEAFIKNAGVWLGQAYRFGETREVHPRTWQAYFNWSRLGAITSKSKSYKMACLFLGKKKLENGELVTTVLTGLRGAIKDGRCDALLLALYGINK